MKVTIPNAVYSQLGPVPVAEVPDLMTNEQSHGAFDYNHRRIKVQTEKDAHFATRLSSLFHEVAHLALWDGGVAPSLPEEIEERVCDAIGVYLAGAVLAGYLTVRVPK